MTDNTLSTIDDIAFSMEEGLSPDARVHLLNVFGAAAAIYGSSADELIQRAELQPGLARSILKRDKHRQAASEVAFMAKHGITAVSSSSALYPTLLKECPDYPPVLYFKGDASVLTAPMIAMVGTRKPNSYGLSSCLRLIEGIAKHMSEAVIVSGLAFGIDVACHRAALSFGLRTLGVLATSLEMVYPASHRQVAEDMARRGGGIASELNSRDVAGKYRFLQRNRIIAGMAAGTVVVQSPNEGGSMITASLADGYNRTVMAPPAGIGDETSAGTNMLIRKLRARMVCSGADVLEELGWLSEEVLGAAPEPSARPEGKDEAGLYDMLCKQGRMSLGQIEEATGIAFNRLTGLMMNLEFEGFVRSLPGNEYEKF